MSDASWLLRGGDVEAALEALAATHRPGALFRVEIAPGSLHDARSHGLERMAEAAVLEHAWAALKLILPGSAVGRRAAWSALEFAVEGEKSTLVALGQEALRIVKQIEGSARLHWHLLFTALQSAAVERTLRCDPGYELRAAERCSIIAWVTPYDGDDWRESTRYPTVTLTPLDQ
jgi:hypothetical protein